MIEYLKYFNIGIMLVAPAVVGLLMGTLLDRGLRSFPAFTVVFLVLGIISGIWSMYKTVRTII